jgi:ADP-ribose pyrophosphatase YjhB (NUDIX family)
MPPRSGAREHWWSLPAGAVDPGETPAEAARRETREEASVEVELLNIGGVFGGYPDFHAFYPNGDEIAWVATVFEARITSGVPAPGDDETGEVRWVTPAEAFELGLTPGTDTCSPGLVRGAPSIPKAGGCLNLQGHCGTVASPPVWCRDPRRRGTSPSPNRRSLPREVRSSALADAPPRSHALPGRSSSPPTLHHAEEPFQRADRSFQGRPAGCP